MASSRLLWAVGIMGVVGGIAGIGAAQAPAKPLAFDVASVNTNISGGDNVDMNPTSTGITIHNTTLQVILRLAFRVQDEQILGGPGWVTKTRFDVVARSETPFPREELRTRLQTRLAERLALRTHNETREKPVYALVRATNRGQFGPQIHVMHAQAASPAKGADQPAFEVASIKPNPTGIGIRGHSFPGDRFEAANVPVRDLIMIAYGDPGRLLPDFMMSGGPSWIDRDRFDIHAKVGSGLPNSIAQKQVMLRGLLADRFKLKVHTELLDAPIYALTLARQDGALGRQLRRSDDSCGDGDAGAVQFYQPGQKARCVANVIPPGILLVRGETMTGIAYALTMTVGRVVQDHTGLTGAFDADAQFNPDGLPDWSPPAPGSPNLDAPSLFQALDQQLGLKLQSTRGSVDVLVIDRVERPTED